MGCSCLKSKPEPIPAYKSLKAIINEIKKKQDLKGIYLIKSKSIPNFLEKIEEEDIINDLNNVNNINNKYLDIKFQEYEEERISFLNNFIECFRLAENDKRGNNDSKENKFIIADDSFVKSINPDDRNIEIFKVDIKFEENKNKVFFNKGYMYFEPKKMENNNSEKYCICYKFIIPDEYNNLKDNDSENKKDDNEQFN